MARAFCLQDAWLSVTGYGSDRGGLSERPASSNSAQLDELMCAALRGESVAWPSTPREDFGEAFIRRAEYQGVMAPLHEHAPRLSTWPSSVRDAVRRHALF